MIWIPATAQALDAGHADSPEEAFQYIRALTDAAASDARIWAFVRGGREMVAWLEAHTHVHLRAHPYADYHPEMPGGKHRLALARGAAAARERPGRGLRAPAPAAPGGAVPGRVSWTLQETGTLLFRSRGWVLTALSIFGNYFLDLPHRLHSARDRRLTLGNALLGRLKLSLNNAGGELWFNAPLRGLIRSDGRIVGALMSVTAARSGSAPAVRWCSPPEASSATPNCGTLPAPVTRAALERLAAHTTSGEALLAAQEIGAATTAMDSAWWGPR